jgi:hypothetical protein
MLVSMGATCNEPRDAQCCVWTFNTPIIELVNAVKKCPILDEELIRQHTTHC